MRVFVKKKRRIGKESGFVYVYQRVKGFKLVFFFLYSKISFIFFSASLGSCSPFYSLKGFFYFFYLVAKKFIYRPVERKEKIMGKEGQTKSENVIQLTLAK